MAEKRTSSGAVPEVGSANASMTGKPGSGMSMPNSTVLVASALPALSAERYSTVCWPSAETVTCDANGVAPRRCWRS